MRTWLLAACRALYVWSFHSDQKLLSLPYCDIISSRRAVGCIKLEFAELSTHIFCLFRRVPLRNCKKLTTFTFQRSFFIFISPHTVTIPQEYLSERDNKTFLMTELINCFRSFFARVLFCFATFFPAFLNSNREWMRKFVKCGVYIVETRAGI